MVHWFTEAVASATTAMTFFTIFLVGVVFSVFSLLLGGHGDHDHDIGHDADHGDAGDGHGGVFSVGILSVRGLALLATGFGGVGFLAYTRTSKIMFSTGVAMVGGYVFALVVLYALRIFKGQQSNSLIDTSSAIGGEGVVTISIPEGGLGEVGMVVSGTEMFKSARSTSGSAIQSGTRVLVDRIVGGTLLVSPQASSPGAS
jgi:hypothetical protein